MSFDKIGDSNRVNLSPGAPHIFWHATNGWGQCRALRYQSKTWKFLQPFFSCNAGISVSFCELQNLALQVVTYGAAVGACASGFQPLSIYDSYGRLWLTGMVHWTCSWQEIHVVLASLLLVFWTGRDSGTHMGRIHQVGACRDLAMERMRGLSTC